MNGSRFSPIGYLLVFAFLFLIVYFLSSDPMVFLNKEALIVICGGLVLAAAASFPLYTLKQTISAIKKVMTVPHKAPVEPAEEVINLAYTGKNSLSDIEGSLDKIEHPFLKEAAELLLEGLDRKHLEDILDKRAEERRDMLAQDVNVIMTLSKYSPALGLGATVLGLVELLGKLGDADLAQLGIGMSVALSATFYGIMIANMVFTPLSELLMSSGETDHKTREMIIDGVLSIHDRNHPLIIAETVNSYLPIMERINLADREELSRSAA